MTAPDPLWRAIKSHGIDLDHVTNVAGPIVRTLVTFTNWGGFEFDDMGEMACAMAVHDTDAETVIDLVAWSIRDPETFGTMFGAPVLGIDTLLNPASYVAGPITLLSTPLAWLKAGCQGAAVLDLAGAREALFRVPGPFTTENLEDAECLLHSGLVPRRKILVPESWRFAA